ncbi:hypothetical protein HML84_03840 [Alcanivorax sp. IO_7]|nr:hypothetical protein HML84_03840 [Alcanivorax sp. IO_7]
MRFHVLRVSPTASLPPGHLAGRDLDGAARGGRPTGFAGLDRLLSQGGWPAQGLVELLCPLPCPPLLHLLLPALAGDQPGARLIANPPERPSALALARAGVPWSGCWCCTASATACCAPATRRPPATPSPPCCCGRRAAPCPRHPAAVAPGRPAGPLPAGAGPAPAGGAPAQPGAPAAGTGLPGPRRTHRYRAQAARRPPRERCHLSLLPEHLRRPPPATATLPALTRRPATAHEPTPALPGRPPNRRAGRPRP